MVAIIKLIIITMLL